MKPAKTFMVGWCAEWALAYKELHGGRICGFVRKHIEWVEEGLVHAFVMMPDGTCIDADGPHTLESMQTKCLPAGLRSWDYTARLMRLSERSIQKRWGIERDGLRAGRSAVKSAGTPERTSAISSTSPLST